MRIMDIMDIMDNIDDSIYVSNNKKLVYNNFIRLVNNKNIVDHILVYSIDAIVKEYLLDRYFNTIQLIEINNMIFIINNINEKYKQQNNDRFCDILQICIIQLIFARNKYIKYIESQIELFLLNTKYDPNMKISSDVIQIFNEFTDICYDCLCINTYMNKIIDLMDYLDNYQQIHINDIYYKQIETIYKLLCKFVEKKKPINLVNIEKNNDIIDQLENNESKMNDEIYLGNSLFLVNAATILISDLTTNKIMKNHHNLIKTLIDKKYMDNINYEENDNFIPNELLIHTLLNEYKFYYENYNNMLNTLDHNSLKSIYVYEHNLNNILIKMRVNNIFSCIDDNYKFNIVNQLLKASNKKLELLSKFK